jgi:hypothetical protein
MSTTVTIRPDRANIAAVMDRLRDNMAKAVRPAAQAGAQVIYDAVKLNVSKLGKYSGNLQAAVYQAYSKENSVPNIKATYHISWNAAKAPHGQLVEFGHIQRYASYIGKDGNWYTAVRPSMRGKPRPGRRASQAVKDAYYVTLANGPRQVPAKPFVRPALDHAAAAVDAIEATLVEHINT